MVVEQAGNSQGTDQTGSPTEEGSRRPQHRRLPAQEPQSSPSSSRQNDDPYPQLRRQLNLPPLRVPRESVVTDENDPSPTNRSSTSSDIVLDGRRHGSSSNGTSERRPRVMTGTEGRENGEPISLGSDDTVRQRRSGDTVRPVVLTPNRRQINNGQTPSNGEQRTVVTVQGAGTARRNALANVLHGLSTAQIVRIISSRENLQQQEDDPFKSKHC